MEVDHRVNSQATGYLETDLANRINEANVDSRNGEQEQDVCDDESILSYEVFTCRLHIDNTFLHLHYYDSERWSQ